MLSTYIDHTISSTLRYYFRLQRMQSSLGKIFFSPGLPQMKIAFLLLCGKAQHNSKTLLCTRVNAGEVILFLFTLEAIWQLVFVEET